MARTLYRFSKIDTKFLEFEDKGQYFLINKNTEKRYLDCKMKF